MRKINLGCGHLQKDGYINIDIADYGQEIVRDLNLGIPFDDESVDEIYTAHFLEHIASLEFLLSECYRVLKKGALIYLIVPTIKRPEAYYPEHKNHFSEMSFKGKSILDKYEIVESIVNERGDLHQKMRKK